MVTEEKKKFDIFDYLKKDKTMYEKLDNYLGGYLKGNYSTNNLLDLFRDYGTYFKYSDADKVFLQTAYRDILSKLITNIDLAILKPSSQNSFTSEEKSEFLHELQAIDKDYFFPTIREYFSLLKAKNFTDEYYSNNEFFAKLNKAVIDKGLEVSNKDFNKITKKSILEIYLGKVANMLKEKYPNRANVYIPEWEEFNFINQTFGNLKRFEEYEKVLSDYQNEVRNFEENTSTRIKCIERRKRYVARRLYEGMKPEEQEKANESSPIEVIYPEIPNLTLRQDTHKWRVKLYNKPQWVCDSIARYSTSGEENQRVIAVSYGRLESESIFNKDGNFTLKNMLQLLGISRFGQDGLKNYFVLTSLPNNILMQAIKLDEGEHGKNFSIDEFKNIMQKANIENSSYIYKIPKELEAYYATVVFSDECLNKAISQNSRFVGIVDVCNGKPRISAGYGEQARNIESAYHACTYPGIVGEKRYDSLNAFCKSTELFAKHIDTVNEIAFTSLRNKAQGEVR